MGDTYWQFWVVYGPNFTSVYNSQIPLFSMKFENASSIRLIKIQKIDFLFVEFDYTRYFKIFQRKWREYHRMRKKAFKYLRMRELGFQYHLA